MEIITTMLHYKQFLFKMKLIADFEIKIYFQHTRI